MKIRNTGLALIALALGLASNALWGAEQPGWINAADNKILAQKLVNQQMAKSKNGDLYILGLHATVPGEKAQKMIACNLDRINKPDSPDDIMCTEKHMTLVFQKLADPVIFEVLVPLQDVAGNTIGCCVFVFKDFKTGSDESDYYMRAVVMRDEMAKSIPNFAAIFQPTQL
ncbi:MAG: hypothetical protein PHQ04_01945 [Opitutaceae bacterium]|nr:hypothetical protein [Opitutaceae bacterium]